MRKTSIASPLVLDDPLKIKSIFSALDGNHLDDALFGSHVKKDDRGTKHAKTEPTRISRRRRLGRRRKSDPADRGENGR